MRLKALGLSEERIAQLVGQGTIGRYTAQGFFSRAPTTSATGATTGDPGDVALLAWAVALVEGAISYAGPLPLRFKETPLVPVQVYDAVGYVRRLLQALAYAHTMVDSGGFGRWELDYWQCSISRALETLRELHRAMKPYLES